MTDFAGRADVLALGRYEEADSGSLRFAWSGSGFAVRFAGSQLRAALGGTRAWLNVRVDGGAFQVMEVVPEMDWVVLASGLESGEHQVTVQKRTEPLVGELVLSALDCDGVLLAPPCSSGVRIEFVGDSITCGYGNLAPDSSYPFDPATEDFARSYAGLVAQQLDADVHCVAWSGLGAVRNFDIEPSPTMLERYRYANPITKVDWDFSRWVPQVVVINLGSNDHYRTPPPDPEVFCAALEGFVAKIVERVPGVKVVLLDGPLLKNGFPIDAQGTALASLDAVRSHLDAVAVRFEPNLHRLSLTPSHSDLGYGADWHPSLAQHELNARELAGFLKTQVL